MKAAEVETAIWMLCLPSAGELRTTGFTGDINLIETQRPLIRTRGNLSIPPPEGG